MGEMKRLHELGKTLKDIDDSSYEGTLEAARLIKTRLRELFAENHDRFDMDGDFKAVAVGAGRGYIEACEYIDNAEKRQKLIRSNESKMSP